MPQEKKNEAHQIVGEAGRDYTANDIQMATRDIEKESIVLANEEIVRRV